MMLARGTPIWIVSIPGLSIISIILYSVTEMDYFMALSIVLLAAFLPVMAFFRDPERPAGKGVVSPADGRVVRVERKRGKTLVSIFMNIHNVHVNRFPWNGRVLSVEHIDGGYVPAFDKDSDTNERVVIRFATDSGVWQVTQIAGAVARRIVPYVGEGDQLSKGDRFGMIRFGSRVDLEFKPPGGMDIVVKVGDRVKAGSTSIAR